VQLEAATVIAAAGVQLLLLLLVLMPQTLHIPRAGAAAAAWEVACANSSTIGTSTVGSSWCLC
jgi:hypothetical protein